MLIFLRFIICEIILGEISWTDPITSISDLVKQVIVKLLGLSTSIESQNRTLRPDHLNRLPMQLQKK